jgi:hypothetical protein
MPNIRNQSSMYFVVSLIMRPVSLSVLLRTVPCCSQLEAFSDYHRRQRTALAERLEFASNYIANATNIKITSRSTLMDDFSEPAFGHRVCG